MKLPSKKLFGKAYGKFFIPATNISNPERAQGLFNIAQKMQVPFIIQTIPATKEFTHLTILLNYNKSAAQIYPDVVFAVHVDHGYESRIHNAINSGKCASVMLDASHDDIEKKIERIKTIVAMAHPITSL